MYALCQNTNNTHGSRFAQLTTLTLLQKNPIASIMTIFFQNSLSRSVDFSIKPPPQRAMEHGKSRRSDPVFLIWSLSKQTAHSIKVKPIIRHFLEIVEMKRILSEYGLFFLGKSPTRKAKTGQITIRTAPWWGVAERIPSSILLRWGLDVVKPLSSSLPTATAAHPSHSRKRKHRGDQQGQARRLGHRLGAQSVLRRGGRS